ncbi:MarR family winged helix-turn-helix transcriptional regulator [Streptomyces sp. NPDC005562]|uniref:MarR family winged helix-turn-helix transcriptional regulator n=1 Tax=Streptomyces sp. NPDC005562 TaxID=3154890 RepID=UPI0033AE471F
MIEGDVDETYALKARRSRDKSTRNNHGHAVTCALATATARAGWNKSQYIEALLGSSKGGNHAKAMRHNKGHEEAEPYLERVWERAKAFTGVSTISDRKDAIADLMRLRAEISAMPWRGTAENTALRVLMAFWHAAMKAGGRAFTLSYREAAEIAGCTVATAHRAVKKRLINRWLRLMESSKGESGSTWCLLNGSHKRNTPKGAPASPCPSDVSSVRNMEIDPAVIHRLMGLDAFAHRGLGMSSLKVLAALAARDGQTVKDLVDSACMSSATAYRVVKLLAKHDLTVRVGEVWQLTETAQKALSEAWEGWDLVADREGTLGTLKRRQALHRAQREAWLTVTLPRLRERRMPSVTPIRGDEVQGCSWDGTAFDPSTGEVFPDLVVASDGRFLFIGSEPEPDYETLVQRAREAELSYQAA